MRALFSIALFAMLSTIQGCGQTKSTNTVKNKQNQASSDIAILPYNSSLHWIFKDAQNADLGTKELNEIETLFKRCIADYNVKAEEQYQKLKQEHPGSKFEKSQIVLDLNRYKRQYVAVINTKGEKEVWINCFCNTWEKDWKKEIVIVMDGGNCYFNLKINLAKQTSYEMSVNGEA
ncbi:MAG: hypothetical protein WAQ28_15160 [Bacteroidia bacterium]|jgi:hypothetical protein